VREVFRRVDPPFAVLVDLSTLFPRQPHGRGRDHPHGLQMTAIVEGQLTWEDVPSFVELRWRPGDHQAAV